MGNPCCRFCETPLTDTFADLGMSPISNAYVRVDDLSKMELFYPLHARVCRECKLVQLEELESPEQLFDEYAYFSSYSESWLRHAEEYAAMIIPDLGLTSKSLVVELASNDGYLLQFFRNRSIRVLGVDPAANVAEVAREKGIPTEVAFFGCQTASRLVDQGKRPDLLVGNNVLAHVPNINDFVGGMKILLASSGTITMEFPHLMRLIENNEFDTIYHEHFSYLSLITVERIFAHHGLRLFNVEELGTHGGSLRIYICHQDDSRPVGDSIHQLKHREDEAGLNNLDIYRSFNDKAQITKRRLLEFLISVKEQGKVVIGYGAPAKGNTLLNYCGIRTDFIEFTVDRNPHKQGRFLPGTRIPIHAPERIGEVRPDYVMILPWNIKEEIMEQVSYIREWGGQFIVPIPEVKIYA